MTAREKKMLKQVLSYLHCADRGQRTELQIHAGAFKAVPEEGMPAWEGAVPSLEELSFAIRLANGMQFIRGVAGRFSAMKWNLTDAGEAALLELNE